MLDDLKMIHERDAQDALGIAEKQWQQLEQTYDIDLGSLNHEIQNIVLCGMGGSALGALIARSWPSFDVPFEIVRDYEAPSYVSRASLFFASSYSGNTEETISGLEQAEAKNANIIIITSGGKLAEIAHAKNYPLLLLPSGLQPRHAVLYSLKALLTATDTLGLSKDKAKQLADQAEYLKQVATGWLPTVPTSQNAAKQLALEVIGKSVVVYSGPKLWPAAYKWKISFNENAKHIAWTNQIPEFNHNEFMGWTKQPVDKPYAVINLVSSLDSERVQKRFEVTKQLLSGVWPNPIVVQVEGQTLLEQMLWTIMLGDFVSIYTALLGGINPTPVDLIEQFKKSLG